VVYGIRKSRLESKRWTIAAKCSTGSWISSPKTHPRDAGTPAHQPPRHRRAPPHRRSQTLSPGDHRHARFTQTGIDYERRARTVGVSKFSFYDNIMLALDGIINHSVVPLRMATYVGMAIAAITVLASVGYIIAYFTVGFRAPPDSPPHRTHPRSLGINALLLGVIGEYSAACTSR